MIHSVGSKTYPHLVLSVIRNCLVLNASFGLMLNDGLMFQELLVSMKKWGGHYIPSFFYPRLRIWLTQPCIFRNSSQSFDPLLKSCVSVRNRACLHSRKEPLLSGGEYFTFLPWSWQNLDYRHREGAEGTIGNCSFPSLWLKFLEMPGL